MSESGASFVDRELAFTIAPAGDGWVVDGEGRARLSSPQAVARMYHLDAGLSIVVCAYERAGLTLDRAIERCRAGVSSTAKSSVRPVVVRGLDVEVQRASFHEPTLPSLRLEYCVWRRGNWFYELEGMLELPRDRQQARELLEELERGFESFEPDLSVEPEGRAPAPIGDDATLDAFRTAERFVHIGHRMALRTPSGWKAVDREGGAQYWNGASFVADDRSGSMEITFGALHEDDVPAVLRSCDERNGWRSTALSERIASILPGAEVAAWLQPKDIGAELDFDAVLAFVHWGRVRIDLFAESWLGLEPSQLEDIAVCFAGAIERLMQRDADAARAERDAMLAGFGDWDPEHDLRLDWTLQRGTFRDELLSYELARPSVLQSYRLRVAPSDGPREYILNVISAEDGLSVLLRVVTSKLDLERFHQELVQLETVETCAVRRLDLGERELLVSSVDLADAEDPSDVPQRIQVASVQLGDGHFLVLECRESQRLLAAHPAALEEIAGWLRFDLEPMPPAFETERGWIVPRLGIAVEACDVSWTPVREESESDEHGGRWTFERDAASLIIGLGYRPHCRPWQRDEWDAYEREALLAGDDWRYRPCSEELPLMDIFDRQESGASWWYEDLAQGRRGRIAIWSAWRGRFRVQFLLTEREIDPRHAAPPDPGLFAGFRWL